jgi:hypothetical protein
VTRFLAALVGGVVLTAAACNSRQSVIDSTSPTAPSGSLGSAPLPASSLVSIVVDPPAVFGGSTATGRVLLSFPAPAGGVAVGLSSTSTAASVPPSVVVPSGSDSLLFNIATQSVSTEASVGIVGRTADREVQGTLGVWTRVPPFVAMWVDPGNGQRTTVGRITRNGVWTANCYGSDVAINATESPNFYHFDFSAPEGKPMVPGTYDNARTGFEPVRMPDRPALQILAPGTGYSACSAPQRSRFIVTEADLVADSLGTVRRFSVTFEQQCGTATIRGELSIVGVPTTNTTSGNTCIR